MYLLSDYLASASKALICLLNSSISASNTGYLLLLMIYFRRNISTFCASMMLSLVILISYICFTLSRA